MADPIAKLVILGDGRVVFGVDGLSRDEAREIGENIRQWMDFVAGLQHVLVLRGSFEVIDLRSHAIPLTDPPHGD